MARSYGQIMSAIWNDPDFRKLTGSAQRAYLMLITQADISSAGTLPLTVGRWSRYAGDTPSDALWHALSELQSAAFIVYDRDTEELLVRKFVKWDGGAGNMKRRPAITAAANTVASAAVAAVLARELTALGVEHALSDALCGETSKERDTPRIQVNLGDQIPNPETGTLKPESVALALAAPSRANPRGQRIPADWRPSTELVEWHRAEGIPDDLARRELPRFRDYWTAKSGKDAAKADWPATWRNWLRRAADDQPGRAAPTGSTADQRVNEGRALAARLRAEQESA